MSHYGELNRFMAFAFCMTGVCWGLITPYLRKKVIQNIG